MTIKIFFGDKPFYITDHLNQTREASIQNPETVFINEISRTSINKAIQQLLRPDSNMVVLLTPEPEKAMELLKNEFIIIQAAGGFIYSPDHYLLLIFRRGKWDLPKGKLDIGEDPESCALREVYEETGLKHLTSEKKICSSWHTYYDHAGHVLKETSWYMMYSPGQQLTIAQNEEDIEECRWVPVDGLDPYYHKIHPSLIDVIQKGIEEISQTNNRDRSVF